MCVQRRRLARHHVLVELGRPPHGLAGVVDDEVEPVAGAEQLPAERLDARRVAQVEPEDLEAVAPLGEVRLRGVAGRRVAGKARGDDQVRAGAQQLEARPDSRSSPGRRSAAPRGPRRSASSVRLAKLNAAHGGHSWS